MSKPDWPASVAQVIASEVRRHRDARKMSARQLAERCAGLGMEIPQAVIANLENGRRPLVSVAELLVLAAALDVPPVLLVAPLGHRETTEILPGRDLETWDAVLWLSGETRLSHDPSETQTDWMKLGDDDAVVPLYHEHDRLVEGCEALYRTAELLDREGNVIANAQDLRHDVIDRLARHRALMQQRGLLLPPLPEGLEAELATESSRKRHR